MSKINLICLTIASAFMLFSCRNKTNKDDVVIPETKIIPLNCQYTNSDFDYTESKRFDKRIERFIRQWELVGASVAVSRNDSLIYCKGYGFASKEDSIPTNVNNIFRVASISKLITGVTIMKLCEEGVLSLDSKVFGEDGIFNDSITINNITDKKLKNLTIEHLLRHQGGFSQRAGDPMFDLSIIERVLEKKPPFKTDDIYNFVLKTRLRYQPGSYAIYSNVGYALLGNIIEKVTNTEYEKYVREKILIPAGCHNIYLGKNIKAEHYPDEVNYYEPEDHDLVPSILEPDSLVRKCNGGNDVRLLGAAGGWVASPIELLKFVTAINGSNSPNRLLSDESVNLMTLKYKGGFPIGWMRTFGASWVRSGNMAGTTALIRKQQDGFTWVFIANKSNWKGAVFTSSINEMMQQNSKNIKNVSAKESLEGAFITTSQ